jgi:hypothetical protein
VRFDLQLKEALQGPVGAADLIADAFGKRKIRFHRGGLAPRLDPAGSGLLPCQWRPSSFAAESVIAHPDATGKRAPTGGSRNEPLSLKSQLVLFA